LAAVKEEAEENETPLTMASQSAESEPVEGFEVGVTDN
jgi:hypothetical protein